VPASPDTGVNTLTGKGLADVLQGASVVVDVSNSPSFEEKAEARAMPSTPSSLPVVRIPFTHAGRSATGHRNMWSR
jgi:hypothetical protein